MSKIKACFILEQGRYIEVPVEEVLEHGSYRHKFKNRCFYRFGSYLLEMSREDRRFFYACQESMEHMVKQPKKLLKAEKQIKVVSLEELMEHTGDGNMRLDVLSGQETDPAEQVEVRMMAEAVRAYRSQLSPEEDELLTEYFDRGVSDRILAKRYHVSQSTITRKRNRILDRLLNFLKAK